ncbi:Satratoxin biosynthesis SC1 cluster protein [Lachnellula suecica]|uniref:Satratoxin biosynthesis SC1 cluster protein n=1 Tax=Lachnellula suecica TaxID=602035 RepID=A0A8T9CDX0_9HELO|nr:Satratoxin biosynthesis SC1 cluster protein [Lachnellula suecica]
MSEFPFPTPLYPGIDVDANDGSKINAVSITFMAISFSTICLRMFSRWWTKIEFGTDDHLILFAAFLTWIYSAIMIYEVQQNFFGQHIGKVDVVHLTSFVKALYVGSILYPVCLTFSKLSLLALYWRIFRVSSGRIPVIVACAVNIAWMTAAVLVGIFMCVPVQGFWNPQIKARCVRYPVFFISNEAFTIALDIVVLVMPVYFISSIKRSLSQRISISSTFLLGLVVTVISCIRLWRLVHAGQLPGFDPTFDDVDAGMWGVIELNLWVVVASIPTIRPLIGKIMRDREETKKSGSGSSYTYALSSFGRSYKTKLGRSKGSSLPSSDSRDPLPIEGYALSVPGKSQDSARY